VIHYEDATTRHARIIAGSMRPSDVAEVWDGWGLEPFEAIRVAITGSFYARTMFCGMEPLAIFGLAPLSIMGGASRVWVFGTSAIDRHGFAFARASRKALDDLLTRASVITNLIDTGDVRAGRWLDWLGARYVSQPLSKEGRVFAQFVLAAPVQESQACQQG